jgi:hypothetical protein
MKLLLLEENNTTKNSKLNGSIWVKKSAIIIIED